MTPSAPLEYGSPWKMPVWGYWIIGPREPVIPAGEFIKGLLDIPLVTI